MGKRVESKVPAYLHVGRCRSASTAIRPAFLDGDDTQKRKANIRQSTHREDNLPVTVLIAGQGYLEHV